MNKYFFQRSILVVLFLSFLTGFGLIAYYIDQYNSSEYYLSSLLLNNNDKIEKAFFSPDHDLLNILVSLIENEKEEISIAIFSLTHKDIADALIAAHERGIKIECAADKSYLKDKFSKISNLINVNIPVWIYGTKEFFFNESLMHNKFLIFKRNLKNKSILWTGSFNFTNRACKANQENIIILDSPEIIDSYKKQFEVIKKRCALLSEKAESLLTAKHKKSSSNYILNILSNWKDYILGQN